MKFEQMQYARPDFDAARETFASLRARIAAAPDAQAQLEAFREFETLRAGAGSEHDPRRQQQKAG